MPSRLALQAGMDTPEHPLVAYAKGKSISLASIAEKASCSRMTLYRVMRGENSTTDLLQRISEATGGAVSAAQLLPKREVAQ